MHSSSFCGTVLCHVEHIAFLVHLHTKYQLYFPSETIMPLTASWFSPEGPVSLHPLKGW